MTKNNGFVMLRGCLVRTSTMKRCQLRGLKVAVDKNTGKAVGQRKVGRTRTTRRQVEETQAIC